MKEFSDMTSGVVERLEQYGLYLRSQGRRVIVLIPDVSRERIGDLTKIFHVGQNVDIKVMEFISKLNIYKATMILD